MGAFRQLECRPHVPPLGARGTMPEHIFEGPWFGVPLITCLILRFLFQVCTARTDACHSGIYLQVPTACPRQALYRSNLLINVSFLDLRRLPLLQCYTAIRLRRSQWFTFGSPSIDVHLRIYAPRRRIRNGSWWFFGVHSVFPLKGGAPARSVKPETVAAWPILTLPTYQP